MDMSDLMKILLVANDTIGELTGGNASKLDKNASHVEIVKGVTERLVWTAPHSQLIPGSYVYSTASGDIICVVHPPHINYRDRWRIDNKCAASKKSSILDKTERNLYDSREEVHDVVLKHLKEIGYIFIGERNK